MRKWRNWQPRQTWKLSDKARKSLLESPKFGGNP